MCNILKILPENVAHNWYLTMLKFSRQIIENILIFKLILSHKASKHKRIN